jgi:hypothetical protein
VRTSLAGSLRFPEQRQSSQGESGAKPRQRCVGDAQAVHILLPPMTVASLPDCVNPSRNDSRSDFAPSTTRREGAIYAIVTERRESTRSKAERDCHGS